ncbi:MAG: MFS transporter [Alphaproteobacteria bacterium]|nr:MFS transporter [Alphaproteobacteria bacterium]
MRKIVHSLWPLFFGLSLMMLGNGLQGTLLGVRATIEDFNTTSTGFIMSLYYLGFVFGSYFAPKLVKNVGHIRVFTALASLASVTVLLHGVIVDIWFWAFIRVFTGFSYAGLYIVVESWLNDASTNKTRGKILALYQVISYGGMVGGQFLLTTADPATVTLFILTSVLVSIALIPISLSSRPAPSFDEPEHISLKKLFSMSPTGIICAFGSGMSASIILGLGAVYAIEIGLPLAQIPTFIAIYLLGGVLFQIPIGWLSDRYNRRTILILICFLSCIISLGCFLASGGSLLFYILFFLLGGCSLSIYGQCLAHTNDHIAPRYFVAAGSSLILVNGVGAALGPLIVSIFMTVLSIEVYFLSLTVLFFIIFAYGLYRTQRSPSIPLEDQGEAIIMPARSAAIELNITEDTPQDS